MENQITQGVTQLQRQASNITNQNTAILKNETPVNKNILAALNSKKISECSASEFDKLVIPYVANAFFKIGKRDSGSLSDNLKFIYDNLQNELQSVVPGLRIKEIEIAINRLIIRDFGDYYGLNIAEITRACKTHYESLERAAAAKFIVKPLDNIEIKPTKNQQYFLFKNLCIDAYERFDKYKNFENMSVSCYDFLDKIGLIIFSKSEKYEFMSQAAGLVMGDCNLKLSVIPEDFQRKPLKRIIELIKSSLTENTPVPEDVKNLVILKAKFVTVKAFFNEIKDNELDLSELIENKKSQFCEA